VRTFGSKYQEWLSKDDLAEGYREWAATYDIVNSCSHSTNIKSVLIRCPSRIFGQKLLYYLEVGILAKRNGLLESNEKEKMNDSLRVHSLLWQVVQEARFRKCQII
jgi:hypothetical protein